MDNNIISVIYSVQKDVNDWSRENFDTFSLRYRMLITSKIGLQQAAHVPQIVASEPHSL